jgi:hypothetical protein
MFVPLVATPVHDVPLVIYIFSQLAAEDAMHKNMDKNSNFFIFSPVIASSGCHRE